MKKYTVKCFCCGAEIPADDAVRTIDCVTKNKRIDCPECFGTRFAIYCTVCGNRTPIELCYIVNEKILCMNCQNKKRKEK